MLDDYEVIKGTDSNDHISPKSGHGRIVTGEGNDVVVISEGDFYEIKGIEDDDAYHPSYSNKNKTILGVIYDAIYSKPKPFEEYDEVSIFIEPEKVDIHEVKYFKANGYTYVQIFDLEEERIIGATKFKGATKVSIVSENGKTGRFPVQLYEENSSLAIETASEIDLLIVNGEAKKIIKTADVEIALEDSYNKGGKTITEKEFLQK